MTLWTVKIFDLWYAEFTTDCSIQQRSALTKPVEVLNRLSVAWPFRNNCQFSLFTLLLRKQSTIESFNR